MAKANPKEIDALYIRTKHNAAAYRRAGFVFNRQGMGIALDALDKNQVKLLKADPHLVVEECTFPADEDAAAKAAAEAEAAQRAEAEKVAAEVEAAKKAEADKAAAEAEAAKKAEADKAAAEAEAAKKAEADKAAAEAEAAKKAEADKAAADAKKQADKAGSAKGQGR